MRSTRVDDSCPYCKNRKLLRGFNDLATAYPELGVEWDFERNGDLGPDGIVSGSARRVWWRCGRGHAWQISAYNRTGGADRGCPYCGDRKVLIGLNGLRTTHPRIARGWDKERNGDLKPTDVIASSNKRVWWKCKEGHEWSGLIANRGARARRTRAARTARGARCSPATTTWPPASRHSGDVAPAHEQALEAHRRAGRKPQARMVARRVRPRLPDGRPWQGEGQAGLLPVLLREEKAREADKARLALGPSVRKERAASAPPAYRRGFAANGLVSLA